jgi:hypothetical protein
MTLGRSDATVVRTTYLSDPQGGPNRQGALSDFSPVDEEPPLRWQRVVHLAPPAGLGVARRAVLFALLGWLPIAAWAVIRGRFMDAPIGEPLLQHFGVHVRCLVAIPLLIFGEATLHRAALLYSSQFLTSGLIDDATRPAFEAALRAVRRWRDLTLPWLFIIGAALAWTFVDRTPKQADELSWAFDENGALGFGGVWFAYLVRPVFAALLLGWLWRIILLVMLFVRLGRLTLSLVPSHPDRAGGLGFLERLPAAFAPVSLALSAMLASRWAHQIVYHGQTVATLKLPATTFVVIWSLLVVMPLVPLMRVLIAAKRAALPSYAAMVAEQGRQVRQRWIEGTTKEGSMLEPEGVGVIADASTMFSAVRSMRILPIGKSSLAAIVVPIGIPMLLVAALQVPIKTVLLSLLKALM